MGRILICLFAVSQVLWAQTPEFVPAPDWEPYVLAPKEDSSIGNESIERSSLLGDLSQARFMSVDRLAHKYPMFSPYVYAANNPVIFVDPNGDSINVAGSQQQPFINLLSQRTGLLFQQNGGGNLVVVPGPVNSSSTSSQLRDLAIQLVSSENTISINTMDQNAAVFFDADARTASAGLGNALDMGDFSSIGSSPELQASLLGHILAERNTAGGFDAAHRTALGVETSIMSEFSRGSATLRTSPFFDPASASYMRARGPLHGNLYFNAFDYGSHSYYIAAPDRRPFNPNLVVGVVRMP